MKTELNPHVEQLIFSRLFELARTNTYDRSLLDDEIEERDSLIADYPVIADSVAESIYSEYHDI